MQVEAGVLDWMWISELCEERSTPPDPGERCERSRLAFNTLARA
jgi:hypothetical protein